MSIRTTRRGFMQSTAALAAAATVAPSFSTAPAFAAAPGLDRVSVVGPDILDEAGRHVSLRGAVTITSGVTSDAPNAPTHAIDLTDADYAHMRACGFTSQAIRLESCLMGATAECKMQDAYLEKLERWVTSAEKAGIYTNFKMTTYDSPSWTWANAFKPARWQEFWDNKNGQQDVFLASWKVLWTHFRGRKSIIGYDILNEPAQGTRIANLNDFNRDYLFPFYRKASAALRGVDGDVALQFQPAPVLMRKTPNMRLEKLDDPHPLFTTHLYPIPLSNAVPEANHFESLAAEFNYAMLYCEFGYPNHSFQGIMPTWTPEGEIVPANIFDRAGRGWNRIWYAHTPTWGILNADGSDSPAMDMLVRPFPRRAAGKPHGWIYDFTTRQFHVKLHAAPASVTAPTEIFVARMRHYPAGVSVLIDGRVAASIGADGMLAPGGDGSLAYNNDGEILSIPARGMPMQITLKPA